MSATKPGDNFASIALRISTTFSSRGQEKTESFIVKVEHFSEGFQKEALKDRILFETEIGMYGQVIPEMQRLIQEIDKHETLAPR